MTSRGEALIKRLQEQTENGGLSWTRDTDTQVYADSKDGKYRFLVRRFYESTGDALLRQAMGLRYEPKIRYMLRVHPLREGEAQPTSTSVLDQSSRPELSSALQTLWSVVQDSIDLPPDTAEQVLASLG